MKPKKKARKPERLKIYDYLFAKADDNLDGERFIFIPSFESKWILGVHQIARLRRWLDRAERWINEQERKPNA